MDKDDVIEKTATGFKTIIRTFLESDVGARCSVEQVRSSSFSGDYGADRFNLMLPYSNHQLKCQLILNHHQPLLPPDFIFEDPFFMDNIEDMDTAVPSLDKWDLAKADGLVTVFAEFLQWYKDHHVQQLQEELPEFYEEYVCLITEMNQQNIEPYVSWKDTRFAASFTLKLVLDCSRVPCLLLKECSDAVGLQIVNKANQKLKLAELYVSEDLEEFFMGFPKAMRPDSIPGLEKDQTLHSYIFTLRTFVQDKIDEACDILLKRKQFVLACISAFPQFFLEHDTEFYKKVVFHVKHPKTSFSFVITVNLTDRFPSQPPVVHLSSAYLSTMGRPKKLDGPDFAYNEQWGPEEIGESFQQYLSGALRHMKAAHDVK